MAIKNHTFSITDSWEKNWVYSKHSGKEFGKFVRTAGKFFNNEEEDKGNLILTIDIYLILKVLLIKNDRRKMVLFSYVSFFFFCESNVTV
jgi:hypothetical protein